MKNQIIHYISRKIEKHFKKDVYIVGGCVRDVLLNRQTYDFDFVVNSLFESNLKLLAKDLNSKLIVLDPVRKIYRIVLEIDKKKYNIDFSQMVGESIYTDLNSRDFTINALAVKIDDLQQKIRKDKLIALNSSLSDLEKKIIKHIHLKNLIEDPLRMLRAFRFAAELNFKIHPKTLKIIKENKERIRISAPERVSYELFKILSVENSSKFMKKIIDCQLLEEIIPQFKDVRESPKKFYFHKNGLSEHLLESLKALEFIYKHIQRIFKNNSTEVESHINELITLSTKRKTLLKFVTLLHDIAKPQCAKISNGKVKFQNHEKIGANMIENIYQKLRLSIDEIKFAKKLVLNHMRPFNLFNNKIITDRAKYRLHRDLGDDFIDLLLLSLADSYSYRKCKTAMMYKPTEEFKNFIHNLLQFHIEKKKIESMPKIIDGHIIMKEFNLHPGPLIGELLDLAKEAQLLGKIKTTEEAITFLKKYIEKHKKM